MSSQILTHTYRRDSNEMVQEKTHDVDGESNLSRSSSPDHPTNLKYFNRQEETVLSTKKSFCIDALLSKQIDSETPTLQEKMTQQKYLAFIQQKNYIHRYQNQGSENYEHQIEHSTINRFNNSFEKQVSGTFSFFFWKGLFIGIVEFEARGLGFDSRCWHARHMIVL